MLHKANNIAMWFVSLWVFVSFFVGVRTEIEWLGKAFPNAMWIFAHNREDDSVAKGEVREQDVEIRARELLCENGFMPWCEPAKDSKRLLDPTAVGGVVLERTVTYQRKEQITEPK